MELNISPLDTLFFRDGKPFTMGEETWADSYLLPPPSVIYGAMRTAIASQNDISYAEVPKKLSKDFFEITGIYYNLSSNSVFPLPLDMVEYEKEAHLKLVEEDEKSYEVKPLRLVKTMDMVTKATKRAVFHLKSADGMQVKELENGFIATTELEKYLNDDLESTKAIKLGDYVQNEPKIGIGRNDLTRSVEEGLLYRTDMKRSDGIQIRVSFDLKGYQNISPLVRLGGEGKLAHLTTTRWPFKLVNKDIIFKSNRFKIYFSTPALLINGVPDLAKLGLDAKLATLVAVCVGKPVYIGGFDMVKREPKPMYRAVPAGSVFYYESASDVSLLHAKQGISLSDERAEEGFGIAYFGTWSIAE